MITGQQVKDAMIAAGITRVEHHACGICDYMTAYVRNGEHLYFDVGCHCSSSGDLRVRDWGTAANWINIQSSPDVKADLMRQFGLVANSPAAKNNNEEMTDYE